MFEKVQMTLSSKVKSMIRTMLIQVSWQCELLFQTLLVSLY